MSDKKKSVLHIKDIRKSFGTAEVLKGIFAELKEGEMSTFLGPSGCGKTTLVKLLMGDEKPSSADEIFDSSSARFKRSSCSLAIRTRNLGVILYPIFSIFMLPKT